MKSCICTRPRYHQRFFIWMMPMCYNVCTKHVCFRVLAYHGFYSNNQDLAWMMKYPMKLFTFQLCNRQVHWELPSVRKVTAEDHCTHSWHAKVDINCSGRMHGIQMIAVILSCAILSRNSFYMTVMTMAWWHHDMETISPTVGLW